MTRVGFIIDISPANEADGLVPEEVEEASRQLRELLLEEDDLEVSNVPADVVPGTRAVLETVGGSLMVILLAVRMARHASKDVQKLAEKLKESSADLKSASRDLRATADNLAESLAILAPRLAARLSSFRDRHPDVKAVLIFPRQEPQDITNQRPEEIEATIKKGVTTAATSAEGEQSQ
jgi:hypothetical protein